MSRDSCPGCDGTLFRASISGREVGTYTPCASCVEREAELLAKWKDVMVATPVFGPTGKVPRIRFDPPST